MLTSQPSFMFTIDELHPTAGIRQREDHAGWRPPRRRGSNGLGNRGDWLYFSGNTAQAVRPVPLQAGQTQPPNIAPYKTCSMYYAHGVIWIVPFDASEHQVGDGTHGAPDDANIPEYSSSDEESQTADWRSLSFSTTDNRDSYAKTEALHGRMLSCRQDQLSWHDQLLPDAYRSDTWIPLTRAQDPRGGLAGDLPILLGLIALSGAEGRARVSQTMGQCLQSDEWRAHGPRRGVGCECQ